MLLEGCLLLLMAWEERNSIPSRHHRQDLAFSQRQCTLKQETLPERNVNIHKKMKFSWSRTVGEFQIWRVISPALPGSLCWSWRARWLDPGREQGRQEKQIETRWHHERSIPVGMGLRGVARLIVMPQWSSGATESGGGRCWLFPWTLPCGLNTSERHIRSIGK